MGVLTENTTSMTIERGGLVHSTYLLSVIPLSVGHKLLTVGGDEEGHGGYQKANESVGMHCDGCRTEGAGYNVQNKSLWVVIK